MRGDAQQWVAEVSLDYGTPPKATSFQIRSYSTCDLQPFDRRLMMPIVTELIPMDGM